MDQNYTYEISYYAYTNDPPVPAIKMFDETGELYAVITVNYEGFMYMPEMVTFPTYKYEWSLINQVIEDLKIIHVNSHPNIGIVSGVLPNPDVLNKLDYVNARHWIDALKKYYTDNAIDDNIEDTDDTEE